MIRGNVVRTSPTDERNLYFNAPMSLNNYLISGLAKVGQIVRMYNERGEYDLKVIIRDGSGGLTTRDLVDKSKLQETQIVNEAPTTSTAGKAGDIVEVNGVLYECFGQKNNEYIWKKVDFVDSSNFIELTNHILDTVNYTRLDISFIESKRINNKGVVLDYPNGGATWAVSNEIDISQYDYLKINARTGWNAAYFAIYDENHNPIYFEVSPNSAPTIYNANIILPENAHYIVISRLGESFDAYVSYPIFKAPTKQAQTITSQSTHEQIPTAKAVYDYAAEAKSTENKIKADAALVAGESLITESLLEPYNVTFTNVEYTTTAKKSLMADGTIIDFSSGGVSNVVELTPDTLYECNCAGVGGGGAYFFLYDQKDNISAIYPAVTTDVKNFVFKASNKFKKIQFNVRGSDCYLRAITLNGLKVEDNLSEVEDNLSEVEDNLSEAENNFIKFTNHILDTVDYTRLDISFIESKYINNKGVVLDYPNGGTSWTVSNEIDISQYDYLKINACTGWNAAYFAIYDENHNPIYFEVSPNSAPTVYNATIILPKNAHYLVISKFGASFDAYVSYPVFKEPQKWEGKKWVCIGDSLTEANSATSKHYFDYIADETGITTVNYGIGGSGYVNPGGTAGNFTERMTSVPTDADVYTIFGSFNDYAYSVNNEIPIGTPEDSGTSTICGYINSAFDALFARVPLANLGVVAPCPWVSVNSVTGTKSKAFAEEYVSALRQCCECRSIPFLDLYHGSGLRPWDSNFNDLIYTKDNLHGLHPNETGHAILAPKFNTFLNSLL